MRLHELCGRKHQPGGGRQQLSELRNRLVFTIGGIYHLLPLPQRAVRNFVRRDIVYDLLDRHVLQRASFNGLCELFGGHLPVRAWR